jgi:hypothetical protein
MQPEAGAIGALEFPLDAWGGPWWLLDGRVDGLTGGRRGEFAKVQGDGRLGVDGRAQWGRTALFHPLATEP